MVLQYDNDNLLLPKFTCSEALNDELSCSWKDALVAKPLGRNIGVATLDKQVRE